MRHISIPLLFVLALSHIACGGSNTAPVQDEPDADDSDTSTTPADDDAGPGIDNGAPSTTYPAPHPPLPQLASQGGAILKTPKVFLIHYPGYPYVTQLQNFAKTLGASAYWSAATSEWGIGPITYVDSKELTGETPPTNISSTEVDAFINGKIASGAFGSPDPNTIYTIFYPSTTTITASTGLAGSSKSCVSFGGYHSDTAVTSGSASGATNYAFTVIPTCGKFAGLEGIDTVTAALSHEWAEAVTDPFPTTNNGGDSAYSIVDLNHIIWFVLGGMENGDLCAPRLEAYFKTSGFDFVTQSVWSNVAAKKGGDPCVPKPTGVYFNAAPVLDEKVSLDFTSFGSGGMVPTKGVKIAKGSSKTIEVDLFSDGDTKGPWKVSAVDAMTRLTGAAPTLDFKWDRESGQNGEKLHVTITVTGSSKFGKAHPFMIASTLGGRERTWPGLVSE